jgi:DNA-binding transcriptional MerR regulator/quercetin dioxygenase-like cupin family protein
MSAPTAQPGSQRAQRRARAAGGRRVRIGQAAQQIGVSPSALRLWERQGLVRPARTRSGYRLYSAADLEILGRVRRMREVDRVNAPGIRRILAGGEAGSSEARGVDGRRLRAMRGAARLSLRQASDRSGLSVSFISAVERGATGASVAALQRLTAMYGTTLLDLFPIDTAVGRLVRPAHRPILHLAGNGVRIEQLARPGGRLEPQLFILDEGASSDGAYTHAGEEFMFVLKGTLRVWLGDDEMYRLRAGDALSFPSILPHRWRNEASGETRLLWINTPPTF